MCNETKSKEYNSNQSLLEDSVFRWVLSLTAFVAIIFIVWALFKYDFDWYGDEAKFFDLLGQFAKIMGLFGAVMTLVALNHRSVQTSLQIQKSEELLKESQKQNKFKNYFDAIEEFDRFFKHWVPTFALLKPVESFNLFQTVFPNCT